MYNPSRGGVRGGADQFTWESVKNDKHRENYLGHSLKAPVGRWQKGKDLSWYAKDRKDGESAERSGRSELASIKRAEEEAMLIALGHNIVKKEAQALSKEEIREALKRNVGDRDDHNIERIDGVGASSQRLALLANVRQDSRQNKEGVSFEGHRKRNDNDDGNRDEKGEDSSVERKLKKKKSKKHKKEKLKKHKKEHSLESENNYKHKSKQKKFSDSDDDERKLSSKIRSHEKYKKKQKDYSSDDSSQSNSDDKLSFKERAHKNVKHKDYSSEELSKSDYGNRKASTKVTNNKEVQQKYMEYSLNELSEYNIDGRKSSKFKNHKSKQKYKSYSCEESSRKHHSHSHKRYERESCSPNVKRRRHDTSESD